VRLLPALASLFTVPIFTAAIGAADYGAYYLISSVATLLSNICVGWLSSALVRMYWPMKREKRLDEYTSTLLWSATVSLLATAMVAGIAALLFRGALQANVARLVPIALLYFVINYLTNVLVQVPRAAKESGAFARLQVAGALVTTGASVIFVWWGHLGAAGIFAGGAVGWTILLIPILRHVRTHGSLSPTHFSRSVLSEFWAYGLPLVPVGISSWALVLIDRFVIQWSAGSAQVGLYSVAYSLGDRIIQLVTVPLLLAMSPSLIQTFEHQGQKLAEKVQTQFIRYFALITFPMLVGLACTAQSLMRAFTSPAYWSAWPVLAIVAAGSVFSSFSQVATSGLAIHKKTKLIMGNAIAAATFNLVANVLLVPRWGFMAAAINTVAAYFLMMTLSWWQSRRYMRLRFPWNDLSRVLVASLVMGAAIWFPFRTAAQTATRAQSLVLVIAQVLIGVIVYALMLFVVREVRDQEMQLARELVSRLTRRSANR